MSDCLCQTKQYQEFEISDNFYHSLSPIHIIRDLMEEHQIILRFCEVLDKCVKEIKKTSCINDSKDICTKLHFISSHLLRTEKHHLREEHTIIRRLVKMAEFEPSHDIRKQHTELWVLKRKLEKTIFGVSTASYSRFLNELSLVSNQIINMIRNHIDLENKILYPQAVKMIPDNNQWHEMHTEAYNIGYCCFTPGIVEPKQ